MPSAQLKEMLVTHPWDEATNRFEAFRRDGLRNRKRLRINTNPTYLDPAEFLVSEECEAAKRLLKASRKSQVILEKTRVNGSPTIAIGLDGNGLYEFEQVSGFTSYFEDKAPDASGRLSTEEGIRRMRFMGNRASFKFYMETLYRKLDTLANQAP